MTDLPPGWASTTLGELCAPVNKIRPVELGRSHFRYIDIGSVDGEKHALTSADRIQVDRAPSRARQLIRSGDILFSTVRPYLKKIAIVPEYLDGEIASTGFCIIRPTVHVDSKFVHYLTVSDAFINTVLPKQRGVSYPAVRDADVYGISVPLPPLAEQRRIVATLEDHLSRMQIANASLSWSSMRLRTWFSLLTMAATSVDGPRESLPPGWTIATIGELAQVGTGATPLRSRKDYYEGGSIPWVTSTLLNSPYIDTAQQYITEKAVDETSVKIYPAGTLLLAMYGEGQTRGRCSELCINAAVNQACAAIVLRPEYESRRAWVKLALEASYERNRRLAVGGVQPNLNLALVRNMRVPLPPPAEQEIALCETERCRTAANQIQRQLSSATRRASALRRSLLARAFIGRLVAQDPNDEPASELLARIRAEREEWPSEGRTRRSRHRPADGIGAFASVQEETPL
jgi:type I restriction enzyme S subunit